MSGSTKFETQPLLAPASERCGLDDFGEPYFIPALDQFIEACIDDGYVPEAGLTNIGETIIKILVNRLRFQQALKLHPEILEQPIVSPLFVLGSPGRVGSTKLHRLLANASNIQSTPLWQVMNPLPQSCAKAGEADPRIAIGEDFCNLIRKQQPQLSAAIQPIARESDEDPYLFDLSFMQFMFNAIAHVPGYMRWIYQQNWNATYRYHKRPLQYLQWQNGSAGKPMLLKGPSHTPHMDVIHRLFPDAKFIQIHRDPVTCIASMAQVVQQGLGRSARVLDPALPSGESTNPD